EQIALKVLESIEGNNKKASQPQVIQLSNEGLQQYVGYYRTNERQSVDVTINGNGLQLRLQNNVISNVEPIGNDEFVLPDGKKVKVIKNEQNVMIGIVRGMRLINKRSETSNGYDSK